MIESLRAAIKDDIDRIDDLEELRFIHDFIRSWKRKNNLICKRLVEKREKELKNQKQGSDDL